MSHQTISTQAQVVSYCNVVAASHSAKVARIVFYSAIAVGGVYVIALPLITSSPPFLALLRGSHVDRIRRASIAAVLGRYKW